MANAKVGPTPFGYKRDDRKLVLHAAEPSPVGFKWPEEGLRRVRHSKKEPLKEALIIFSVLYMFTSLVFP